MAEHANGLSSIDLAADRLQSLGSASSAAASASQSKRDKKRQQLTDRLAALQDKFSRDRDSTYREQLQKIQIDTNLAMRLDPYTDRPLDFLGPDRPTRDREFGRDPDPDGRGGGRGVLEMAGPTFQQWIQEIEDLVEERDAELTKQKFDYDKKAQEHRNTHTFKTDTTIREHKHLASTLRERLSNAITAKKVRLTKEKEALEISDASALLLHPNQFSITNPASPGGAHSKRTTRLRQTADDLGSAAMGGMGGMGGSGSMGGMGGSGSTSKRKRNAVDDDGSPAPQRRADNNGTTALWHGDRLGHRKVTGPVYSIDKLFTDRELAMTYNNAALAAHKYLLTHPGRVSSTGEPVSDTDSDDDASGRDATPMAAVGGVGGVGGVGAVGMERAPSHATRSSRQNHGGQGGHGGHGHGGAPERGFVDDRLVGLEALTNFEMPASLEKLAANEPKMPPMFMSNYAKPHSKMDANTPGMLSADDVTSDLAVIKTLRQYERAHGVGSNFDNANGARKVLEATAFSPHDSRYAAYLRHARRDDPAEGLRKDLRLPPAAAAAAAAAVPTSSARDEPATPMPAHLAAAHASPMSRQSSQSGAAMSRQGSNPRIHRGRR